MTTNDVQLIVPKYEIGVENTDPNKPRQFRVEKHTLGAEADGWRLGIITAITTETTPDQKGQRVDRSPRHAGYMVLSDLRERVVYACGMVPGANIQRTRPDTPLVSFDVGFSDIKEVHWVIASATQFQHMLQLWHEVLPQLDLKAFPTATTDIFVIGVEMGKAYTHTIS